MTAAICNCRVVPQAGQTMGIGSLSLEEKALQSGAVICGIGGGGAPRAPGQGQCGQTRTKWPMEESVRSLQTSLRQQRR